MGGEFGAQADADYSEGIRMNLIGVELLSQSAVDCLPVSRRASTP